MFGLIKKDLMMIKSNIKTIAIMMVVFFIMALNEQTDMMAIPVMLSVVSFLSSFSYDEYNKWNSYAVTMPTGRKNIVKAKYIATIILAVVTIAITILLSFILGRVNGNVDYENIFGTAFGLFASVIFLVSIMYPFIFKFGIEKGRIALFIGVFATVGIVEVLLSTSSIVLPVNLLTFLEKYLFWIVILVSVFMFCVSYKISERIYMNKDF